MAFCACTAIHARVTSRTRVSSRNAKATSVIARASATEPTHVPPAKGRPTETAVGGLNRRVLFATAALASVAPFATLGSPPLAFAEETAGVGAFTTYRDEEDGYAFSVPSTWTQAEGVTKSDPRSARRVVAFYPPNEPDINVNVVATSVGADYPKMGLRRRRGDDPTETETRPGAVLVRP